MEERIVNEVEHGRFLAQHGAGEIWNWEGQAGRLRWERRVKMLSSHLCVGMNVLELGCGTGYFTRELAHSGAHIVAVDVSPELLEVARAGCSPPNVSYEIQNACAMTYRDSHFDSVVGSSVLHHLEIKEALREIYRVLKPGGHFSISDIILEGEIPDKWKEVAELHAGCISGAIQKREYLEIIEEAGFKNMKLQKDKTILIPDEILSGYLSDEEIAEYKNSGTRIASITVYADKPAKDDRNCCEPGSGCC